MKLNAATIASATGGRLLVDAPAGSVLTDTRALGPGTWFLALSGERFDGYDFLDQAAEAGAIGCVVSRPPPASWTGGVVLVEDTTVALQDLGRHVRAQLDVPVVALTGSSGKTTTRALIALALSPLGKVHQTVGNLNNHLGVPMTLLATPADASALVVEMGTSSPGEIEFLCELAQPDVRLLLNVGPAHLLELGGLDGVAVEKGAIVRSSRQGDAVVLNADDHRVAAQREPTGVRRICWGAGEDADVQIVSATLDAQSLSTHAEYQVAGHTHAVRLPVPGAHIAHNAAGAIGCALALGVDPADAVAALAHYAPVGMRLRAEPLGEGVLALNDAYNANPQSMAASVRLLASLDGRRAAVLGDMLELGPDEARWHEEVAALADGLGLDLLVLVGPLMSAAAHATSMTETWAEADGADVIDRLRAWVSPGDRLLFKGSRGARVERILQAIREPAPEGAS